MPAKCKHVRFRNYERKIKSPFMTYAYFESILVLENNGKQNPNESYTNKYQKQFTCRYGYKLLFVNEKFSKPFKSYLGEDSVYNFINSMVKEIKNCSDVMKKHFNKELVMTKKNDEDFMNSTKCCICDNAFVKGDVKVRDHSNVTEKYRGSPHRDSNIKVKLIHRISVLIYNLKKYDVLFLLCKNKTSSILK